MKYYLVFLVSCSCLMLACSMSAMSGLPKEAATVQVLATPTTPAQVQAREVCADGLNVRESPMGDIKAQAERGATLWLYPSQAGWSQIAAGEWVGLWVNASYMCDIITP